MTDTEFNAILNSFDGPYAARNRALLILGVRCGGRVSAVTALQVGDILTHGRFAARIHFRRATVKGKKAGYSLPLHPAAKWAVGRWLVIYRQMMGGKLDARLPLFPARTGRLLKPLSRFQAWRIITEAADRCRLDPGVSPHSWRKTLASRLFKATKSILVVKQILHHRNISTTVAYLNFALAEEAESALMLT
jgi:integrase/recombinase XerD